MSETPERIWDAAADLLAAQAKQLGGYDAALAARDARIAELEAALREWLTAWAGYAEHGDFCITTDAFGVCNDIEKNETATRTRAILGDAE